MSRCKKLIEKIEKLTEGSADSLMKKLIASGDVFTVKKTDHPGVKKGDEVQPELIKGEYLFANRGKPIGVSISKLGLSKGNYRMIADTKDGEQYDTILVRVKD